MNYNFENFDSDNSAKPKRRLSVETRAKISAARRARTKQPRQGQSKRIQTFYGELKKDYANSPEALEWIENNRLVLDDRQYTKEGGLLTEYDNMYFDFYEFKIANLIFGKNATSDSEEVDHGFVSTLENDEEVVSAERVETEDQEIADE